MKPLLSATAAVFQAGCAADTPSALEVRNQFERGLSGHGQIVPFEQQGQPNIDPRAGEPAPGNL